MRAIRADLPTTLESVELLVLADYHYADPHSDHDAIKCDIEYVATHENAYCVLAGDLMNCAIKSSVSDTYGDTLSPMDELMICTELMQPIAHKIVGIVGGNHEARHYKTNGIDMTRILARQLGIEDKYSPDTALVFLRFGRDTQRNGHHRPVCYTIYLTHGSGGGRKEGGKIQRLVDLSTICDADIFICGHTHLPATLKTAFARPNPANSSITYCTKLFINAAAKLNFGGYGDTLGFKPSCKDTPKAILSGTLKDMRAVV
jgi:predicted phosphodiesterase